MDKNLIRKIKIAASLLKKKNRKEFEEFIKKNPEVLSQTSGDYSLLNEAFFISKEACKLVVICGANVDITDTVGSTILNKYASQGDIEMVKFLLDNGAKIDTPESLGETALSWAISHGHLEVADLLIKYGADIYHVISENTDFKVIDLAKKSENAKVRLWANKF